MKKILTLFLILFIFTGCSSSVQEQNNSDTLTRVAQFEAEFFCNQIESELQNNTDFNSEQFSQELLQKYDLTVEQIEKISQENLQNIEYRDQVLQNVQTMCPQSFQTYAQ